MIPEIGHLLLIGAMVISFIGGLLPFIDLSFKNIYSQSYIKPFAYFVSLLILGSFVSLIYSFLVDDFSVLYVAENSNTNLPSYFKFSATWGAHEGSLVLWSFAISLWLVAFVASKKDVNDAFSAITFGVMNQVIFAFLVFTLFTSNPFERILPFSPLEGSDLNPSLQDFAFTIHPPLLYLGYSGLALPFALAVAAMMTNNINAYWAKAARPWSLMSCGFLTLGIGLGSWWAYYELGWGGWWFWDPVENAAFVPWLISIALFHSLIVTQRRDLFKNWSLLLSILAFAASLLGTFLVRSGVLTSVHAFALDPERGVIILGIFSYFIFGSLFIYSLKNSKLKPTNSFDLSSKEFAFLLNNLLLVVLAVSIMFGTIFPILYEAFTGGKQVSVGPPYFNFLIMPFAIGLAFLQGIGLYMGWGKTKDFSFLSRILVEAVSLFVLIAAVLYMLFGKFDASALLACILFAWIVSGSLIEFVLKKPFNSKILNTINSRLGMIFAHIGIAFLVLGVGVVSSYSSEKELILDLGESYEVDGVIFRFKDIKNKQGPNYISKSASIEVTKDNNVMNVITEKRNYLASGQPTTEAGIIAEIFKDYYVALGENKAENKWSFRIQIKPFVRWMWFGALLIAIGSFISSFRQLGRNNE
jgi:cytochrome c-type biogenesis protein CcmF